MTLEISWRPKNAGTVRESLYLTWQGVSRLQVVLHGTALGAMQGGSGRLAKQSSQNKTTTSLKPALAIRYGFLEAGRLNMLLQVLDRDCPLFLKATSPTCQGQDLIS